MIDILHQNKKYKILAQTTYFVIEKAGEKEKLRTSELDAAVQYFDYLTKCKWKMVKE